MKMLLDGTLARVGVKVRVIKTDGLKAGTITHITSIEDTVLNKSGLKVDLSKWKQIVQVSNGWLANINNLKIV